MRYWEHCKQPDHKITIIKTGLACYFGGSCSGITNSHSTKENASIAKITRPKITGVLPRKRLFGIFDGYRKNKTAWVTGPPSSGKTTLVSIYLEARKLSSLWYQVDKGDGDVATFFHYMGLAAHKASPRRHKPLPPLSAEYLQGISAFTKRYFENLYSRLKPPFVVVFDNYHEAPAESLFHEIIRYSFSTIPAGISVILISRNDPPFAFNHKKRNLDASTGGVCKNGFCIKIPERTPLTVGDVMDLRIKDFFVRAQVRWFDSESFPSSTVAGFKVVDGRLNIKD